MEDHLSHTLFPSAALENAINEFAQLPGIGRKTALRLVLSLLRQENGKIRSFGNSIIALSEDIMYCKTCHTLSDSEVCHICANPKRLRDVVCVVENIKDVITIENTAQFNGLYHVLGGIISPMDGIGPSDIEFESLIQRVEDEGVKEIILALPTTTEGDTTGFFIYRNLKETDVKLSTLARGVAVGDNLDYADEITLGRSILNRVPFSQSLNR